VEEAVVEAPQSEADPEVCRRETPTGSRIAVKVCKPKSAWVAKAKRSSGISGTAYVDGNDAQAAPLPPSNE